MTMPLYEFDDEWRKRIVNCTLKCAATKSQAWSRVLTLTSTRSY